MARRPLGWYVALSTLLGVTVPAVTPVPSSPVAAAPLAVNLDFATTLPGMPAGYDYADPHGAARDALAKLSASRGGATHLVDDLLVPLDDRRSPSGHHVRFAAAYDGRPIRGAGGAVHYDVAGQAWLATLHLPAEPPTPWPAAAPEADRFLDVARAATTESGWAPPPGAHASPALRVDGTPREVWVYEDAGFVAAYEARVVPYAGLGPERAGWSVRVHPGDPHRDAALPRWLGADGTGRVFRVSPEVVAQDPDLVDDPQGDETPQMAALTGTVALTRLDEAQGGAFHLRGEYVYVNTTTNDTAANFSYLRSDPRFEDTMSYHHMDVAQAELQRLGFGDANDEPQLVTPPEEGLYNAFYWFIDAITFGYHAPTANGLADAAEDADVVVHEYGHAVQLDILPPDEWSSPDFVSIAEGFADIFAILVLLPAQQGYEPECLGDWFGSYLDGDRADGEPYCFRRTDTDLTYAEVAGEEGHYAGQVLSGFAWNVTLATDRDTALTLITEANYLLPLQGANMPRWAEAVLHASDALYGGAHNLTIAWSAHDRLLDTPLIDDVLGVPYVDPDPPRILSASPSVTFPGDSVLLWGRYFVAPESPGAPTVVIGAVEVEPSAYGSSGAWIEVIVPDLPLGNHPLSVVRSDGLRIDWTGTLFLVAPMVVDPFGPRFAAAGETVTLTGTGLGPSIEAETYSYDANEWRDLATTPSPDGTRLDIAVPADLPGHSRALYLRRVDGAFWADEENFYAIWPALEVTLQEVDQAPPGPLAPAPVGGPEWILRVTNVGSAATVADEGYPTRLWVYARPTEGPAPGAFGSYAAQLDVPDPLGPGESWEHAIDVHPLCGCGWYTGDVLVPLGTWQGEAHVYATYWNDPVYGDNDAYWETRFLLPDEIPELPGWPPATPPLPT